MDLSDVIFKSKRLMFVPLSIAYAEEIFKEFDYELTKYMCPAPPKVIDETLDFIKDACEKMKAGTNYHCAVLSSSTKEFVGCAGIHKINTTKPELGLWVKRSQHSKGYGKEIIAALIDWTKKNYTVEYFIYPVDKRNIPSVKIPESYGAVASRSYQHKSESNRLLKIIEYHIPAK